MSGEPARRTRRERLLRYFRSTRSRLGITIGPAAIWLALFMVVPLLFLVAVSFTVTDEQYNIVWAFTLANYEDLLIREGLSVWETPFVQSLYVSYGIATATTLSTLVISFPAAYYLARRGGRFVRITMFFLLVPFFSVYIVRMYAWFAIFGNGGVANDLLLATGIFDGPLGVFSYGMFPTIVALTHAFVPYMLLTLYATLNGIDFSLLEAAQDLGASRLGAFRDVVIPLVTSGIITGSVFVFIPALGAYLAPELLGRGRILMIGQMIVNRVYTQYSIGYGSAIAMFIAIAVLATFVIVYRVSGVEELIDL